MQRPPLLPEFTFPGWADRGLLGLVGTAGSLACLHLVLTWRLFHRTDQVALNGLFWLAILGLLVQIPRTRPDLKTRLIGLALLGWLVGQSVTLPGETTWWVRLFPALAVFSLGLLHSGVRLRKLSRVGLLVLPLMVPRGLVEQGLELVIGPPVQLLTAQVARVMLHYAGFETTQQHTVIRLNQGAVEVLFHCTGVPLLIVLGQLAFLFLIVFPVSRRGQVTIIAVAGAIAFCFSSLRVAVMAGVVASPTAFAYWHGGQGSQIFSTGAIVLFGWFCQRFLPGIEVHRVVLHPVGNDSQYRDLGQAETLGSLTKGHRPPPLAKPSHQDDSIGF